VVIPHELTHLVFDTAVRNAYHFPPRWLNEGLAVYLSEGYTPSWRAEVTQAVGQHSLLSLEGLTGQFPTSADEFSLAYGESVSAIDFLVRTYGKARLVALIRSFSAGRADDEAFRQALGVNVAGFELAWLADLGATVPVRYGPRPAPTGPLPPGWAGAPGALVGPGTAVPPAGQASAAAGGSGAVGVVSGIPGAGAGVSSGRDSGGLVLVAIAAAGLVAGGLLGYLRRRRLLRPRHGHAPDFPETAP
jgi:hypothetical protein